MGVVGQSNVAATRKECCKKLISDILKLPQHTPYNFRHIFKHNIAKFQTYLNTLNSVGRFTLKLRRHYCIINVEKKKQKKKIGKKN